MPTATLDPALGVRIVGSRELRYTDTPALGEDRPRHVRAASGLALVGRRLVVVQDDAAFIAYVSSTEVSAVPLPRGPGGRRRFEVGLGNKHDKLDLETCVAVGDELWAFGSGGSAQRERIAIVGYATKIFEAGGLYRAMRAELGGDVNIEGAAVAGHELWLFHRGNTGPGDRGPAVLRFARDAFARYCAGDGAAPQVVRLDPYDLGEVRGTRLGFTDAVAVGSRVFYLAAGEASPNAIDDGVVLGSQLGVIDGDQARAAWLADGDVPVKAEGLAFDPENPARAWVAIDPDDVDVPARLYEVELVGPW